MESSLILRSFCPGCVAACVCQCASLDWRHPVRGLMQPLGRLRRALTLQKRMAYRHLLAGVCGGSRCVLRSVMVYVGELRRPGKHGGRLRGIPLRSTFQYRIPFGCLPSCSLPTSSGPRCADRLRSRRPRCLPVVARRRRLRGLPLPDGGKPLRRRIGSRDTHYSPLLKRMVPKP